MKKNVEADRLKSIGGTNKSEEIQKTKLCISHSAIRLRRIEGLHKTLADKNPQPAVYIEPMPRWAITDDKKEILLCLSLMALNTE